MKIFVTKTEGIWLGKLKHCRDKFENVKWTTKVKSLGVYFGTNTQECKNLNFKKIFNKSVNTINCWKQRNLTMIGRITIIKSLILPNITYLASTTSINKNQVLNFKKKYLQLFMEW